MATKWEKVSEGEYVLKPEHAPCNIVATVYLSNVEGRYSSTITNMDTHKRFVTAKPMTLARVKKLAQEMVYSRVVQYG